MVSISEHALCYVLPKTPRVMKPTPVKVLFLLKAYQNMAWIHETKMIRAFETNSLESATNNLHRRTSITKFAN